jgi:hypothetical protein
MDVSLDAGSWDAKSARAKGLVSLFMFRIAFSCLVSRNPYRSLCSRPELYRLASAEWAVRCSYQCGYSWWRKQPGGGREGAVRMVKHMSTR